MRFLLYRDRTFPIGVMLLQVTVTGAMLFCIVIIEISELPVPMVLPRLRSELR